MAPAPPRQPLTVDGIPGAPGWLEKLLGPLNGFMRPTGEALERGLTFRENFAGEVKTVSITPPEDWRAVEYSPGGGFSGVGGSNQSFQVRKTQDGTVKARGIFRRGAGTPAAGTRISDLWADFLPGAREVVITYTEAPVMVGSVSVSPSGLFYESGNVDGISVTGVEWQARNRAPPRWETPLDVSLGQPGKPFPGRPGYVLALACRQENGPTLPATVLALDWAVLPEEKGRKGAGVRIHRVWGLEPKVKYSLTLLVLPE